MNLQKLNTITKYPSIPTYHKLDSSNGKLLDEPILFNQKILGTEKVDGTNARIIWFPDGRYIIGSREDLLYAKGDLIGNPAMGIVEAIKETADRISQLPLSRNIIVLYLEVFGHKIGSNAKQYTNSQKVSFRLFDVAKFPDYEQLEQKDLDQLSSWRENGGQLFLDEESLVGMSNFTSIELTPRLFELDSIPTLISDIPEFMTGYLTETRCKLDPDAQGRPEGIVLRTSNRSIIAKARFEDYNRTLRKK